MSKRPCTPEEIDVLEKAHDILVQRLEAAPDGDHEAYYINYTIGALQPVLYGITGKKCYMEDHSHNPDPPPPAQNFDFPTPTDQIQ